MAEVSLSLWETNKYNLTNESRLLVGFSSGNNSFIQFAQGSGDEPDILPETIRAYDEAYGLVGRVIESTYESGAVAYARILAVGFDDITLDGVVLSAGGGFAIGGWTDGSGGGEPVPADQLCFINVATHIPFIKQKRGGDLSCSEYIIEDSLTTSSKFESNLDFDLEGSECSFELDDSIKNIVLGGYQVHRLFAPATSIFPDFPYVIGVHVVGHFWGYTTPEDVDYDETLGTYSVRAYDWVTLYESDYFKRLLASINTSGLSVIDLRDIIAQYFYQFNGSVVAGSSTELELDISDYNSLTGQLTISQFFTEVAKHYAVFFYYDGDRVLRVSKRLQRREVVASLLLEEGIESGWRYKDYDKLLINGRAWNPDAYSSLRNSGNGRYYTDEQIGGDQLMLIGINEEGGYDVWQYLVSPDLSNLRHSDYLDLSQQLPERASENKLFPIRTPQKTVEDYEDLLAPVAFVSGFVDSLDVHLQDTIQVGTRAFYIREVVKDYNQETTQFYAVRPVRTV